MSAITAVPTPTVDELLELVNGDDRDNHFHCCLLDLTICGQAAEGYTGLGEMLPDEIVSCRACMDIADGRVAWICPGCGCQIDQTCSRCR